MSVRQRDRAERRQMAEIEALSRNLFGGKNFFQIRRLADQAEKNTANIRLNQKKFGSAANGGG